MNSVAAVWRKEFRAFWFSPVAYIVITIFLVILSFMFFQNFFIMNNASMREFFSLIPWFFFGLVPAISMRMWAEERKTGTIEMLMTKPVSEWQAVLGKYFAAMSFIIIVLLLTLPLAITVHLLAQDGLDWGVVAASYLGALLVGAAYMAIGTWASSLSDNQVIAFLLALGMIFVGILVGMPFITNVLPGAAGQVFEYLGLHNHFYSIMRGVIDSRDIIFYLSTVFFFLFITVRTLEHRKWS